jgi:hypothetical protein
MKIVNARNVSGMPVTDEVFEQAVARGRKLYGSIPRATRVHFDSLKREIEIFFEGQDQVRLPISQLKGFASLSDNQLARLEVGFAGKGLILEEADLHISIEGLITEKNIVANQKQ